MLFLQANGHSVVAGLELYIHFLKLLPVEYCVLRMAVDDDTLNIINIIIIFQHKIYVVRVPKKTFYRW